MCGNGAVGSWLENAAEPTAENVIAANLAAVAKELIQRSDELDAALEAQREAGAERDRLLLQLNTPHTADFLEAVRIEAAHQRERWGVDHDAGKRPEDWITLVSYLLGKAARAHFDGERDKLLHHVITLAAVCSNWHANATGADVRMRPGVAPAPDAARSP